jgi:two-component sensor histidine kinase
MSFSSDEAPPDSAAATVAEASRIRVLRSYDILDTPPEAAFDRIVELAQALFDTPIALVSFIDAERQWFKARVGLDVAETPRETAFCAHAIRHTDIMVVPNALADPRFQTNPLVIGEPRIRFYAGAPMITPEGARLGTVCIISPEPRPTLDERDLRRLQALAAIAANELELRRKTAEAESFAREKEILAQEIEHRVRSTLHLVTRVVESQAARADDRKTRKILFDTVDRISGIEAVQRHLSHGAAVFRTDAHAYLLSLVASLQDMASGEQGARTVNVTAADDLEVSRECMAALGMVTVELVTNALKHGQGDVEVSAVRDGETLLLSVSDQGAGFKVSRLPKLTQTHAGLRLVSMLALPGGLMIAPATPQRITVRLPA